MYDGATGARRLTGARPVEHAVYEFLRKNRDAAGRATAFWLKKIFRLFQFLRILVGQFQHPLEPDKRHIKKKIDPGFFDI